MVPSSAHQLLQLSDLRVSVEGREIVHGISLTISSGEVHAIMGPNGSGKSTLVNALAGHPKYSVTGGRALLSGEDLLALSADERARKGLFLAFQYPKEIAGVSLRSFLFAAYNARLHARDPAARKMSPIKFKTMLEKAAERLKMDKLLIERPVNRGFSGGEKKKAEILQMRVLEPLIALLDETDSGLDVDALKIVASGINDMRKPDFSALIVTHYARILEYIVPDKVHVMVRGEIAESGGADFARKLEREGYAKYGEGEGGVGKIILE